MMLNKEYKILVGNGKKINNEEKAKIAKEVLDRCIDVRLFGGNITFRKRFYYIYRTSSY